MYNESSSLVRVTDKDFIRIWKECNGNTVQVANRCGMKIRATMAKRRKVEQRHGIVLNAEKTASEAVVRHHKARTSIKVDNAVLPIGGDVHVWPGQRTTAQRAFVATVKKLKPAYVILVGDVFDGARISRHPRIGFLEDRPTVAQELEAVEKYLEEVEKAAPGAMLIWCLGNHDARYESYLAQNAPEMEGVKGMHLKDKFPKWKPCWAVHINEGTPNHTVIKHRWHNGVHASYNNTLKSGVSFITGHLHKLDARKYADFKGIRYGVDAGFMADLDDDQFVHYTEDNPKDWTSGFPVITFREGRMMRPEFVQKWDEDRIEFRGEVINV